MKPKGKQRKSSPGQMKLPWDEWEATNPEIVKAAERFVFANCYNPKFASIVLQKNNRGFCSTLWEQEQGETRESALPGNGKP